MKTKFRKTSRFTLALQRIKSGPMMKYMASGFCSFTLFPIIYCLSWWLHETYPFFGFWNVVICFLVADIYGILVALVFDLLTRKRNK